MSASVWGRIVPCQAAGWRVSGSSTVPYLASEKTGRSTAAGLVGSDSLVRLARRTPSLDCLVSATAFDFGGGGAGLRLNTVQSLLTSGRAAGNWRSSAGDGIPGLAQRRPEQGPGLQLLGHRRGRELGVERMGCGQRRSRERLEAESFGDLALVLLVELEPGPVAVGRTEDDIGRVVLRRSRSFPAARPGPWRCCSPSKTPSCRRTTRPCCSARACSCGCPARTSRSRSSSCRRAAIRWCRGRCSPSSGLDRLVDRSRNTASALRMREARASPVMSNLVCLIVVSATTRPASFM